MDDIHGSAIHSSRTISFHVRILAYKNSMGLVPDET